MSWALNLKRETGAPLRPGDGTLANFLHFPCALSRAPVEEPDDLEVEGRRHPHSVGIDEFLDHVGAPVAALNGFNYWDSRSFLFQLVAEVVSRFQVEEVGGLMPALPSSRLMEVIQAEAPFGVPADGGGEVAGFARGVQIAHTLCRRCRFWEGRIGGLGAATKQIAALTSPNQGRRLHGSPLRGLACPLSRPAAVAHKAWLIESGGS